MAERGEQSELELVELAAGYGYHFDATELVEHLVHGSTGMELTEAELEAVTGGITGGDETLGRTKKTLMPGLMTKRESEPDKKLSLFTRSLP